MMQGGHCVATIHAEANAILQAARNGVRIDGATLYTTASPCWDCFKLCANAGVVRIVYDEFYREDRIFRIARQLRLPILPLQQAERQSGRAVERQRVGPTVRTAGGKAVPQRRAARRTRGSA
jgi:dCMP deaminase